MSKLPQLYTAQSGIKVINARELHAYVVQEAKGGQKGEDFSNWIKRMLNYGFEKDKDYIIKEYNYKGDEIFSESDNQHVSKREFGLTLDCAKEIAMIQNNDKGREARKYFIECEKKIKSPSMMSKLELARWIVAAEEENERLKQINNENNSVIQELSPKAEYADEVLRSESSILTNVIAKELGMSAVTLNRKLHELGIIYRSGNTWVLYYQFQDQDLAKTKTHTFVDQLGQIQTNIQLVWTEKGRMFIHDLVNKNRKRNIPKQA